MAGKAMRDSHIACREAVDRLLLLPDRVNGVDKS
jgi:hypothetical protein